VALARVQMRRRHFFVAPAVASRAINLHRRCRWPASHQARCARHPPRDPAPRTARRANVRDQRRRSASSRMDDSARWNGHACRLGRGGACASRLSRPSCGRPFVWCGGPIDCSGKRPAWDLQRHRRRLLRGARTRNGHPPALLTPSRQPDRPRQPS